MYSEALHLQTASAILYAINLPTLYHIYATLNDRKALALMHIDTLPTGVVNM
jgi:hypothetical protein